MRVSYLILLLALNWCWAGTLSVYKPLGLWLQPGGIVTLRFGLASVCLAVLWPWLPGKGPRGFDLVKTAVMGCLVFMLGQRVQVWGNKLSTAGNTSILMGLEPLIASVGAAIFLRERIGPRRWAGFMIALLGVALLNGLLAADFQWAGLGASGIFVSSFVCESIYSIMGKPLIERADPMKVLTVALISGTLANLLIDGRQTFLAARVMPGNMWWLIGFLSVICTAIGYGAWLVIIRETDVNVAALTIFMQPLAGVIIAAVWLRESLHLSQLWGSLAIVAGLILGLSRQIKRSEPAGRAT